ncbi:hypothetical protein Cpir12675_003635 [Ceratocystis pirilliformis]|uniref:Uncharacterized protein n=1 Tax=Ceratocystis pirilliformis TaxID=259994 RepID=A0ABR3Z2T3_9PEZI
MSRAVLKYLASSALVLPTGSCPLHTARVGISTHRLTSDDRISWQYKSHQQRTKHTETSAGHTPEANIVSRASAPQKPPAAASTQRRPAFTQPYFFQYKETLERIGRCIKWGCSEEDLELASFIVRNLANNWHTNCAAAYASFRVPGAVLVKINPTTSSLTRAGVVPVNQMFQNLTGHDESFYLTHHEVNVRKPTQRKARSGDKLISFTSFKIHSPPRREAVGDPLPDVKITFATHMFYQATRELAATVQIHSTVMAEEEDLPRIRRTFEDRARDNVDKVTKARKFCFILEKDLRRLEGQTWNRPGAVEDLGSAVRPGAAV